MIGMEIGVVFWLLFALVASGFNLNTNQYFLGALILAVLCVARAVKESKAP